MDLRKTIQIELTAGEYETLILTLTDPSGGSSELAVKFRGAWQTGYQSDFAALAGAISQPKPR
jgi:hypothetical protein